MTEIIDLSQEIFSGMPVYKGLPPVSITTHVTHEEWNGIENPTTSTPAVNKLELGEHTGTHVDALSHMSIKNAGQTIETMPLEMFYTKGICLDFSHKALKELINEREIEEACKKENLEILEGDTVLFYTNHHRKNFGTQQWENGPGLSIEATKWLGNQHISAFGVETMSPGVSGMGNREVHHVCGEMGFTHYENMINLHKLIGKGRFRFIALPLRIKEGTGSPVRAVAVFED